MFSCRIRKTVKKTPSKRDSEQALKELKEEMDYQSPDGYKGKLKLDISTIQSGAAGYKSSSYGISETREYSNLSSSDTSLVPKTITANGKTLKLANVNWKSANSTAVDYEALTDTYTAVATYTGTGTKTNVTGYTTTAIYRGEISKDIQGKTVYTAYFSGTKMKVEPTKLLTQQELKEQLKALQEKEKAQNKANGAMTINPITFIILLLALLVLGGLAYLLLLRKNVTVYTMTTEATAKDGFKKIGKTRLTKGNPIIDLTQFTSKVTTPSFILILGSSLFCVEITYHLPAIR